MSKYLESCDVLKKIKEAIENKKPFSLVRIGDGENIVMAQNSVWSVQKVLKDPWAIKANKGYRGVTLPNLTIRDQMVEGIKKADVVGVLAPNDKIIRAPKQVKRMLTNKVFSYYKLKPVYLCNACINKLEFVNNHLGFWDMLRGKRILLISKHANLLREILQNKPYKMNVTMTIHFSDFKQMDSVFKVISSNKDQFDVAFISCGVNAVILAPKVAELTGNVGIDFGSAANAIIQKSRKPQ